MLSFTRRRLPLLLLTLCASVEAEDMERNYWQAEGEKLRFAGGDLAVSAELPHGFNSLAVKGGEFLQGGEGYGGMAFRKPDGSWVTSFTDISNLSHDDRQGRLGSVADGMYLLRITTAWSLPDFEVYAGFNDPKPHDLVLFMHRDVRALRGTAPKRAVSSSRQIVRQGSTAGTAYKAKEAVAVHESGVALRVSAPVDLELTILKGPDGQPRLAVVIPCKGLAANSITCRYDVHNGRDALTVFPKLTVESPTMGATDPGYRPQSHGHWTLYEKDAQVDFALTFGWLGRKPFKGRMVMSARHALGQPHFRAEATPEKTGEQNGVAQYRAAIRPKFSMPGVSDANIHLVDDTGTVIWTERLRFLYDWPSYRPTCNPPPDLKEFWDQTRAELSKVPLEPKVEAVLFREDPEWSFEHVSFASWKGQRIHACLYIPKKAEKPLPVMIGAHPNTQGFAAKHKSDGVYGSKVKCDPRFVSIFPLIRGHEPDAEDVPFNQPWWGPLDSRDDYVARTWFCTMVRALDYLATRPDLADLTRVVSRGGSQGGALALVTAALDQRVKLCIADCPANSMHHDAVRPGTYGSFGPTSGQVPPGQTLDDLLRTLSYYDPAHLAPWIRCPTVVHLTVGDLTVHSMGGLGVYKNLAGLSDDQKWFLPGVNGHYHAGSRAGGKKAAELIDALLDK